MAKKQRLGAKVAKKTVKLVNPETSEQIEAVAIYKEIDGDDFLRVHLSDLLSLLGILNSKQADVVIYILKHTEFSKNIFYGTYDEIAENSGISRATVTSTMKKLMTANLLAKVRHGVYQLSPALAFKGSDSKRAYIINYYQTNTAHIAVDYVEAANKRR